MNHPTIIVALFIMLLLETVLLASTMDYKIALEQENEHLKAQLAPKSFGRMAYQAVLCPTGNSIAQRIDKRRYDGTIYKSIWRRTCV